MCGIVGALQFDRRCEPLTEAFIARMRERVSHRGPDGAGSWIAPDGSVGLGHRRLAIIDLTASGVQPISDDSERIWLTYNGEIYNHVELRRELESFGHRFRSAGSDSEVLVYAYKQWGIDAVHHLRGMFAFALWDANKRRLWLVRDRIGIKPLYYTKHAGRLIFASEIKALLAVPGLPRAIDEEALFHYLSFLTTPAPMTLFSGIRKLSAGSMLLVHDDGRIEERRYWDAIATAQPVVGTDAEVAAELLDRLRASVRLHKVSDVPLGVFLSGGVDSSTIAALSAQGETNPIRAFTVDYDKDYASYPSEIGYARMAANSIGAELSEIRLSVADLVKFLPRMVELQDEPIADPVCVPLHYVAKLARDNGVMACQVGEGADELFFGYPSWKRSLGLQKLSYNLPTPGWLKDMGLSALQASGKGDSLPYEWLGRARRGQPIFWGGAEAFTGTMKMRMLSRRLREKFSGRSSWEVIAPIRDRYLMNAEEPSLLRWMTYLDLNLRLPELLLMRVDKMTMGNGLEGRVPFLDHDIVEFAMGISDGAKLRNGELKSILKRAVKGVIPDAIIDRPKQGFGVPIEEWFVSELPPELKASVSCFAAQTDLFDRNEVSQLMASPTKAGLRWALLNVSLWWEAFIKPTKISHPVIPAASHEWTNVGYP